jgi:hypothetical protein
VTRFLWAWLTLLISAAAPANAQIPLDIGPHKNLSFKTLPDGAREVTLGEVDPHFWTSIVPASYDPAQHPVFELDYFAPSGLEVILRYRIASGEMKVFRHQPMPPSEAWQPWSVDLSSAAPAPAAGHPEMRFHLALREKPGTTLQIRNLRLRAFNAEELQQRQRIAQLKAQRAADDAAIQAYITQTWPATIDSFHVGLNELTLTGTTQGKARLIGIPPETPSFASRPDHGDGPEVEGSFRITLPRLDPQHQRDRALWRYRLASVDRKSWLSAARWPSLTGPAVGGDLPRLTCPHPKGLGGIHHLSGPDHEIFQLGIGHATVNIVLNSLLRDSPAKGHIPWPSEGHTYYVNQGQLHGLDHNIKLLSSKGIIISAILLVGNHRHADGTPHSILTHPEAETRGIFSIPNLTTEESTRLYAACLRLLAERYSGTPSSPGRISQWIMHNEVDQAGTWTNMGDQPLHRYLETYLRSVRLMHHTARLFDRSARVFLSLTHHWTQRSAGVGTYVVRDMIEQFNRMARAEGDFEWGLAYHPYPRDLRNPDTWKDQDLSTDFDTKYITPKNLEVLPAFMHQERFLFQGKPRGILLSEQGFNTPTLSREDQERQVAGLVYVFRKLKELPQIEAYHLHRYQDMPKGEGGLRLGIIDETGKHKLGFEAYRHLGTGSPEEKAFQQLADEVMKR